MMEKIKKWIVNHPYFLTSAVFLIIVLVGWQVLYWREENFTFVLLLYFIVTLGIRLDDISRKIGTRSGAAPGNPEDKETIMQQLTDIKYALLSINATLNRILEKTEKKDQ
jgi:hypothetical protein